MKVSVIVAAYNIENYIEKCLNSIVNQTLKDIEVIVVNDGSTDNTLNVIQKIAKDYNNIKIIDKQNQGIMESRKSGLNVAIGEYVLFVDGDDWLELDSLEKLYNKAILDDADIVLYNAFLSYDQGKEKLKTFNIFQESTDEDLKEVFLCNILPCIWSKLIRREFIFEKSIILPKYFNYGEDLATTISIFIHKPKITRLNEYLYNYYQRSSSITHTSDSKILDIFKVISFIEEQLKNNNLYEKYKDEFEYMVFEHTFYKIIDIKRFEKQYRYVHREIYNNIKKRNINIRNNKYIINKYKQFNINLRVRLSIYNYNYYLGKQYDFIRRFKNSLVNN